MLASLNLTPKLCCFEVGYVPYMWQIELLVTPVMTMSNPSHEICTMSCGLQDMEKFNSILLYTKNLENNCFIL